jgi:hypothetical protein
MVRVLLQYGANGEAKDNGGDTPEDYATAYIININTTHSQSHLQIVAMLQAEAVTRAKCVAFAMGHHERLGVGSRMEALDPEVVRKVLEQVWRVRRAAVVVHSHENAEQEWCGVTKRESLCSGQEIYAAVLCV